MALSWDGAGAAYLLASAPLAKAHGADAAIYESPADLGQDIYQDGGRPCLNNTDWQGRRLNGKQRQLRAQVCRHLCGARLSSSLPSLTLCYAALELCS